nr:hypothetical protein [Paenibacillus shirakamiensis]
MNRAALKKLDAATIEALVQVVAGAENSILSEVATAQVVPKQTGELERSGHVDDSKAKRGKVKLVYDTPYARRQYWHPEYNFRQDKNANAKGKWLEDWEKSNFIQKAFQKLLKKFSGGYIK